MAFQSKQEEELTRLNPVDLDREQEKLPQYEANQKSPSSSDQTIEKKRERSQNSIQYLSSETSFRESHSAVENQNSHLIPSSGYGTRETTNEG